MNTTGGFLPLPPWVVCDKLLTDLQIRVLLAMWGYCNGRKNGWAFDLREIAIDIGKKVSTVREAVNGSGRYGGKRHVVGLAEPDPRSGRDAFVTVCERRDADGRQRFNLYRMNLQAFEGVADVDPVDNFDVAPFTGANILAPVNDDGEPKTQMPRSWRPGAKKLAGARQHIGDVGRSPVPKNKIPEPPNPLAENGQGELPMLVGLKGAKIVEAKNRQEQTWLRDSSAFIGRACKFCRKVLKESEHVIVRESNGMRRAEILVLGTWQTPFLSERGRNRQKPVFVPEDAIHFACHALNTKLEQAARTEAEAQAARAEAEAQAARAEAEAAETEFWRHMPQWSDEQIDEYVEKNKNPHDFRSKRTWREWAIEQLSQSWAAARRAENKAIAS